MIERKSDRPTETRPLHQRERRDSSIRLISNQRLRALASNFPNYKPDWDAIAERMVALRGTRHEGKLRNNSLGFAGLVAEVHLHTVLETLDELIGQEISLSPPQPSPDSPFRLEGGFGWATVYDQQTGLSIAEYDGYALVDGLPTAFEVKVGDRGSALSEKTTERVLHPLGAILNRDTFGYVFVTPQSGEDYVRFERRGGLVARLYTNTRQFDIDVQRFQFNYGIPNW